MISDNSAPIALSALQHFMFCPRQCALIHVEQTWAENLYTAEGRLMHEATSQPGHEKRRGVRVVMAMPLASHRLGVSGVADLVELHPNEKGGDRKKWHPFPVEYKRGRPKAHRADEVQLCAQAFCLEEMFGVELKEGALFYGKTHRRVTVPFDDELRTLTQKTAQDCHALIDTGQTPPPQYEKRKCNACSLLELCKPERLQGRSSARRWLQKRLEEV